jgi:pyruvate dehydrogenase E1 component alpha subunit
MDFTSGDLPGTAPLSSASAGEAPATNGRGAGTNLNGDELLKFYHDMLLIRRFEERAGQLYGMG